MPVQHRKSVAASAGWFTRFATRSSTVVGSPAIFIFAW